MKCFCGVVALFRCFIRLTEVGCIDDVTEKGSQTIQHLNCILNDAPKLNLTLFPIIRVAMWIFFNLLSPFDWFVARSTKGPKATRSLTTTTNRVSGLSLPLLLVLPWSHLSYQYQWVKNRSLSLLNLCSFNVTPSCWPILSFVILSKSLSQQNMQNKYVKNRSW